MSDAALEVKLARLEERVEERFKTLFADMDETRKSLKAIEGFVNEVRGGKKLLMAIWAIAGGIVVWLVDHASGWFGK